MPGPAGAQPLGQGALRGQLHLELAGEELPLELLVLPDVGRGHPPDPALGQQQAQAPVVDTAVVAHDVEIGDARRRAGRRSGRWGCRTGRSRRRPGARRRGCRRLPRRRWRRSCPRDPPAGSGYARHDIRRRVAIRGRSASRRPDPRSAEASLRAAGSAGADVLGGGRARLVAADARAGPRRLDADRVDPVVGLAEGQVQARAPLGVLAQDRSRDGGLQGAGRLELVGGVPDGRRCSTPSRGR